MGEVAPKVTERGFEEIEVAPKVTERGFEEIEVAPKVTQMENQVK